MTTAPKSPDAGDRVPHFTRCARCRYEIGVSDTRPVLCYDCESLALAHLEPFTVDRESYLMGYAAAFTELCSWKMRDSLARRLVRT